MKRAAVTLLAWTAVTLVALPARAQSDGESGGPAAGTSSAPPAGSPGSHAAAPAEAGEDEAPSAPTPDDASAASPGEPYAADPYAVDIPGEDAGIPAVLSRDEPAGSAGEAEDPSAG